MIDDDVPMTGLEREEREDCWLFPAMDLTLYSAQPMHFMGWAGVGGGMEGDVEGLVSLPLTDISSVVDAIVEGSSAAVEGEEDKIGKEGDLAAGESAGITDTEPVTEPESCLVVKTDPVVCVRQVGGTTRSRMSTGVDIIGLNC